ncbi:hypothetical protein J1TS5_10050 [Paenibacillus macerans]|uniref:hypothetical protein n=1 Tax=Paenibacillus macerans TaxID=44252 RepID=UPI001B259102|nr:hypothetical protein [Paenibacillus macerans]GIP08835.1 hypothetical protein J1TS5_10050 [Paenibacillus macerans]
MIANADNPYIPQLKKMYTIDPGVLSELDWVFVMIGTVGTVLSTAAFVYWLYKLLVFLAMVASGKDSIRNRKVWKNLLLGLLLIFLFISGSVILIISRFFDFMSLLGW